MNEVGSQVCCFVMIGWCYPAFFQLWVVGKNRSRETVHSDNAPTFEPNSKMGKKEAKMACEEAYTVDKVKKILQFCS